MDQAPAEQRMKTTKMREEEDHSKCNVHRDKEEKQ
jgi:hypothetical protein